QDLFLDRGLGAVRRPAVGPPPPRLARQCRHSLDPRRLRLPGPGVLGEQVRSRDGPRPVVVPGRSRPAQGPSPRLLPSTRNLFTIDRPIMLQADPRLERYAPLAVAWRAVIA